MISGKTIRTIYNTATFVAAFCTGWDGHEILFSIFFVAWLLGMGVTAMYAIVGEGDEEDEESEGLYQ